MRQNQFLKKVLCYTISMALFLQPQLVVAMELVSLEKAEPCQYKQKSFYIQQIAAVATGKSLHLSLHDDLKGLTVPLHLTDSSGKSLVTLIPSQDELILQTSSDTPLVVTQGDNPFPCLNIQSFGPVTVEADRLSNSLTVQAVHIVLARSMQVEKELCLWTVDFSQIESSSTPKTMDQRIAAILKGSGTVTTKSLQGNGSLSLISSQFHNANLVHLKTIGLFTHLRNAEEGNLCAEETLSVSGSVHNEGVFRSKQTLTETGDVIHHTSTARVFAGLVHRVTAERHEHSGCSYVGTLSQIGASYIKLGEDYKFRGSVFVATASDGLINHSSSHIHSQFYIELTNQTALVNNGQLEVRHAGFPYQKFFELGHPDAPSLLTGRDARIAKEASTRQLEKDTTRARNKFGSGIFDGLHGIVLQSDLLTVSQCGDVTTSASDLVLRAPKVRHLGKSIIGNSGPASMHVIAKNATLEGIIRASQSLLATIDSRLILGGFIKTPLVQSMAQTIDMSGFLEADQLLVESAQRVSMLTSSTVAIDHAQIGTKQLDVGGVLTGKTLLVEDADHVVFLPSAATTIDHSQIASKHLSLEGTYTGESLSHKGDGFTLGGTSAIKTVIAQETDHLTLTGNHTGDLLKAEAGRGIYQSGDSDLTLETGAYLSAPEKILAGLLKAKSLETSGRTLFFEGTSRITLGQLLSRDTQSVKFGSKEETRKWASGEWFHDIGQCSIEASDLAINAPTKIGQALVKATRARVSVRTQINRFNVTATHFTNADDLTLLEPSRIEATYLENTGHVDVAQQLAVKVQNTSGLGNITGAGQVDIDAQHCADPEATLFAETGIRPEKGISLTIPHDMTIEREHTVDHHARAKAKSIVVKADQTAKGGIALETSDGVLDVEGRTFSASGKAISLKAQGGSLRGQDLRTISDIFYFASSEDAYMGGAICSAPIMESDVDGTLYTSRPDGFVPVTITGQVCRDYGPNYFKPASILSWSMTTMEPRFKPAQFLSHGFTQDERKGHQHLRAGRYEGNGTKETDGSTERVTDRVLHSSDWPILLDLARGGNLSRAHIIAKDNMFSMTTEQGDLNVNNILCEASHAQLIARHGHVNQGAEVFKNQYFRSQSGRTGGGGEYTYETINRGETQTAEGNIWRLSGGRQKGASGLDIPTLLLQAGKGKSITSQYVQIYAPNGLVARYAPGGTISDTTIAVTDWHSEHHQTWGKGFNNNWHSYSSHTRNLGGCIIGNTEVLDCLNLFETGLDRVIEGIFYQRAQNVHRSAAVNDFHAYSTMSSQKDGSDIFSKSGSATHRQTTTVHYATPNIFKTGHFIEEKPDASQPGTSTWTGPIQIFNGASTLRLDQCFEAIQQTMEQTSFSQVDNCSSFTPSQYSMPQFGSHPLQMLKGFNQAAGYANESLNLIKTVKSGNPYLIALEVAGKFTNFSSTESEQSMRQYEMTEAAPFLNLGRTHFDNIAQITGTLAGMTMDSPTGRVKLFDVRAPLYERAMEARSTTTTTSCNPLKLSFGQSNSWSEQSSFDRGSQHSFVNIFGRPDVRIDEYRGYGVGLNTLPTGGDQDFTQRTIKVLIDGRIIEVPYLERAGASSGVPLIARPTGNRVSVGDMYITAPSYENGYSIASGHSHWGVSLLPIVLALIPGGQGLAMMTLMSSINVGFGGENKEGYHRGTKAMSFSALGAPIDVDNLYTKGNASVGYGIHAKTHHHEDVQEEHRDDSSYDIAGRVLEFGTEGLAAWNNVDGLINHYKYWTHSGPTEQDSRDIDKLLVKVLREDAEAEARERDRQTSSGRPSRASQSGDSDRDPRDGQRRGRTSTRETEDRRSARSTVNFLGREANVVEDLSSYMDSVDAARSRQQRQEAHTQSDRDGGDQPTRGRARTREEDARRSAIHHAEHVTQGIVDGIAFMHKASGRAHTPPGARYAREEVRKMEINNGGFLDQGRRQNAMEFHGDRYIERIQERQDARNAVLAAALCLPLATGALLYGGVTGLDGLHDIASGVNRSATNVLGHMATDAAQFYIGGKVFESLFACAKAAPKSGDNPFTRFAANTNARNPLTMDASLAARIAARPANQNTALLFDIRNGTNGFPLTTRMGQGGRSDIPGVFGSGRAEGVGVGSDGARAIPSGGGSSGPSQGTFIRRIDKSQAHADRMARVDDLGVPKSAVNPQGAAQKELKPSSAQSRADHERHKEQLRTEQRTGEYNQNVERLQHDLMSNGGKRMAGPKTDIIVKDEPRLIATYGGKPGDWAKIKGQNYRLETGETIEIHAYQNVTTGQIVEPKTKIQ